MKQLMLALILLASCYGLLFSEKVTEIDRFAPSRKSSTPFSDTRSFTLVAYAGIWARRFLWWSVCGRRFVWEVQYSELSEKVCGGGIVCPSCRDLVFEVAERNSALLRLDSSVPFAPCGYEVNSLEVRRGLVACISALRPRVTSILPDGAQPQVRSSIVKPIMVDVIDMRIICAEPENQTVHANGLALSVFPVSMHGVAKAEVPGGECHDGVVVLIVDQGVSVTPPEIETVPHGELCLLPRQNTEPTRDGEVTRYIAPNLHSV